MFANRMRSDRLKTVAMRLKDETVYDSRSNV